MSRTCEEATAEALVEQRERLEVLETLKAELESSQVTANRPEVRAIEIEGKIGGIVYAVNGLIRETLQEIDRLERRAFSYASTVQEEVTP